ncbi:hypothetical protein KAR91_22680 [Candidatus Pacearchaeota archaeon]|nr:hypothetical protein [Candidatus Pacearchaeota archaeon]
MINATVQITNSIEEILIISGITALFVTLGLIAIFLTIAAYIYHSLAWMTIAKKENYKYPWLAWIPFANQAMRLQMGGFAWQWIFLILIPVLGWIALFTLILISNWKIFEDLKYPGWLGLAPILDIIANGVGTIAHLVIIGIVAWKKPEKKQTKKKRKVAKKKAAKKKK